MSLSSATNAIARALLENLNLVFLAFFLVFGSIFLNLVWFPGIFLLFAVFFGLLGVLLTLNEVKRK